jgi:hypothetical protein
MRLAAILAVLLLYAGSAFAHCGMDHQTTASNDQAAAQSDDQQLPKAKSGS